MDIYELFDKKSKIITLTRFNAPQENADIQVNEIRKSRRGKNEINKELETTPKKQRKILKLKNIITELKNSLEFQKQT